MERQLERRRVAAAACAARCLVAACLALACAKHAPDAEARPAASLFTSSVAASATAGKSKATAAQTNALPYATWTLGGGDRDPLPWIVALHGLGDSPDRFVQIVSQSSVHAHVYAPRGLYPYGDGYDWFRARVQGDPERLAQAMRRAMVEVLGFVDARAAEARNVGKPILLGFSQGGMLTFALATHHPDRFRLAIPIGGLLPKPLWPDRKLPGELTIVALHGTEDPRVPIARTRALTSHLQALGYQASLLEFEGVRHAVPPAERARLFEILDSELSR